MALAEVTQSNGYSSCAAKMRYFFIIVLLIVGVFSNALLLLPLTPWEIGSILLVDLGVILGFYAVYLHYWTYDDWGEAEKLKPAALFLIWFGLIFCYLGLHVWVSGDYHIKGSRARTAIYRDLLNAAGDTLGPWSVASIWIGMGVLCLCYGWKGYNKR